MYMDGFKHKFTFFLGTIPNISNYLLPIEDVLQSQFMPAITGSHIYSDGEWNLLTFPKKFGGLAFQNVVQIANLELSN